MLSFLGRYAVFAKYAAVAIACLGVFLWYRHQVNTAYANGMEEGGIRERAEWIARESKELVEQNAKIHALEEAYRALERKSAQDVADATTKAKKEINHAKAKTAAALADRDRFRLRWSTQCTAATGEGDGRNRPAAPGTPAGGALGTTACELPREVRDDLIRLAGDADQVVLERNALLEIVKKDREVCK